MRAAAQPKQRRGLVKATQVFRAGLVVHAEFYSVLANLLSVPSSVLWSYLLLLWYIAVGLSVLCEGTSSLWLCDSVLWQYQWCHACFVLRGVCCVVESSQLIPAGLSLPNSFVSPWFRNTDHKMSQFIWTRVTVAGAGMLWLSYALGTAQMMVRGWRPERLQLLRPWQSYRGQVHQTRNSWLHVTVGVTSLMWCCRQTLQRAACLQSTCCSWKLDLKLALPLGLCSATVCCSVTTWILDLERLLIIS